MDDDLLTKLFTGNDVMLNVGAGPSHITNDSQSTSVFVVPRPSSRDPLLDDMTLFGELAIATDVESHDSQLSVSEGMINFCIPLVYHHFGISCFIISHRIPIRYSSSKSRATI